MSFNIKVHRALSMNSIQLFLYYVVLVTITHKYTHLDTYMIIAYAFTILYIVYTNRYSIKVTGYGHICQICADPDT